VNRAERRKRISNYRKPGKLDAYNEALAQRGLFQLHPTKGYRKVGFRRLMAATNTQLMLEGRGDLRHVFQAAQAFKRARTRAQNPEVPSPSSEAPEGPQVLQEEE
jgi:hypothetical protein